MPKMKLLGYYMPNNYIALKIGIYKLPRTDGGRTFLKATAEDYNELIYWQQ